MLNPVNDDTAPQHLKTAPVRVTSRYINEVAVMSQQAGITKISGENDQHNPPHSFVTPRLDAKDFNLKTKRQVAPLRTMLAKWMVELPCVSTVTSNSKRVISELCRYGIDTAGHYHPNGYEH